MVEPQSLAGAVLAGAAGLLLLPPERGWEAAVLAAAVYTLLRTGDLAPGPLRVRAGAREHRIALKARPLRAEIPRRSVRCRLWRRPPPAARVWHRMRGMGEVYEHVTPAMKEQVRTVLEECWQRSLQALKPAEREWTVEKVPRLGEYYRAPDEKRAS